MARLSERGRETSDPISSWPHVFRFLDPLFDRAQYHRAQYPRSNENKGDAYREIH
jgi:hypothetical protein